MVILFLLDTTEICLQVNINNELKYAEVQFYFLYQVRDDYVVPYALISLYRLPEPRLLDESSGALFACKYNREVALQIVDARKIVSVVSMQPLPAFSNEFSDLLWFVVQKSGIDDNELIGYMDQEE